MITDRTQRHMAREAEDLLDVRHPAIEPPTAPQDPWCDRCKARHPTTFNFRGRVRDWHEGQR